MTIEEREIVKAMLIEALTSSIQYPEDAARLIGGAEYRLTVQTPTLDKDGNPEKVTFDYSTFDLDKLAHHVAEWFAARERQ